MLISSLPHHDTGLHLVHNTNSVFCRNRNTHNAATLTYLKSDIDQVATFEGSVRAGHGDDLGFLHQQVVGSVRSAAQQLKCTELLQGILQTLPFTQTCIFCDHDAFHRNTQLPLSALKTACTT